MLRRLARAGLDVLLPPLCLGCEIEVDAPGTLCATCWNSLRFIATPSCATCGLPFAVDAGVGLLCAPCIQDPPRFDRARLVFIYDETGRRLVLKFKHGDRTDAAPAFGAWLARAGAELTADVDCVAPVPLHWTRLFARRYNQAALLAHVVGAHLGIPVIPDLLTRKRRTPSQSRLSRDARRRNVAWAFAVTPARSEQLRGWRILLIDNVYTTGATLGACSRVLKDGGASAVKALTLARVVAEDL
ncbi:MAG: ComF family protein [Rhodospirillales bacterium]|nr:ComF family protein [Rhodospirillales bacterium]